MKSTKTFTLQNGLKAEQVEKANGINIESCSSGDNQRQQDSYFLKYNHNPD